jgi:hypothetical protein
MHWTLLFILFISSQALAARRLVIRQSNNETETTTTLPMVSPTQILNESTSVSISPTPSVITFGASDGTEDTFWTGQNIAIICVVASVVLIGGIFIFYIRKVNKNKKINRLRRSMNSFEGRPK